MYLPPPDYGYLLGLIDDTGIYEHARFGVPRREHGYTVDDAARALIVLCAAPAGDEIESAQRVLLAFILDSVTPEGRFRNRLSFDRRWMDGGSSGDTQGRGIWALAVAAATASEAGLRHAARSALGDIPLLRSPYLRPIAYTALGAHVLFETDSDDPMAMALAENAGWLLRELPRPWPEPRLTYANGRLPAAMLSVGAILDDPDLIEHGLRSLEWLVGVETRGDHFSYAPVGGWAPGEPRPGFDQQPIEAAALSDACERASSLTREEVWTDRVRRCGAWLLGDNDGAVALYDPTTGATRDGLTEDGVNANTGAESTISGLSVLQACQRVGIRALGHRATAGKVVTPHP